MKLQSLLELASKKAINDHRSLKIDLTSLPRTILNSLLFASVQQDRVLTLETLVTRWPLRELVLRNCDALDESHAVLLAGYLQKSGHEIRVVDITGCDIGTRGTSAFCSMTQHRILQTQKPSTPDEAPCYRTSSLTVFLDCIANQDNYFLVKEALVDHTSVDIKVHKLSISELHRSKLCSLVSLLEADVINTLHCPFNSLEQEGVVTLCRSLITFTNLTDLNLAYNLIKHRDFEAIDGLASTFSILTNLKKLDLSENQLGSGVCQVLQSLKVNLTHLNIGGCGIRESELDAFMGIDSLCHLEVLDLSRNGMSYAVKAMCRFICKSATSLRFLLIEDNIFTAEHVPRLCRMLKKLSSLETLFICYNHLIPDDIKIIREAIPSVDVINRDYLF
ncbi:uncharacterized protein LOC5510134 [Nematostella vectensis]|uniref:uncharacterized protein LOC5510134 n=1 Tax=Nematostella vectensis TaxID=45351 RepID=UPI0020777069|nr:uncharacterized protein LOC5510134 [Nematostella vectensis]